MIPAPGQPVPFQKYQGTGNDFVLLDWTCRQLPSPEAITTLCNRRLGIGADGLLLLVPATTQTPTARMILFNPNASRAEMCGNGLRCAALHALTRTKPPSPANTVVIQTDAGPRSCEALSLQISSASIRVDMGAVSEPQNIILTDPPVHFIQMSVGNPHAVLLDEPLASQLATLGPTLASHPFFPAGTNVGFVRNHDSRGFDLEVWERGAGATLACGTGACAAVAAAWTEGKLLSPRDVEVRLPGGRLLVDFNPATRQVHLTGNAVHVYDGSIAWPE